ncbi:MAG: 3-hydroxyacyl-CoA dehydrogenase/enoyl-CoA hydratase family protein, partial [Euryarchaeota archaeon]|nr:3-hydroxyacyl-CoA dehydrogenase/enoyl-CoA hydratase family protein [Euryarchaeota archaeon]
ALLAGECPEGFDADDKMVSRQLKSLSRTAPIALNMANDLINNAQDTTLDEGLQGELDGLVEIFSTTDSLEGLSALIEGRRATFQNQ